MILGSTLPQNIHFVFLALFLELVTRFDCVLSRNNQLSATDHQETVHKRPSAMEQILAANFHINDKPKSGKNTQKKEQVENSILSANDAEKVTNKLFEGDVLLDTFTNPEDMKLASLQEADASHNAISLQYAANKRQATRNLKWLWHSKKIPYVISPSLDSVKYHILKAIGTFNSKTCVKFVPKEGYKKNYVLFDKRQGCYSRIGKSYTRPGPQIISVGDFCDSEGVIIHEMLHALGFFHEQSRPDRQDHIEIFWENIRPDSKDQFLKYDRGHIDHLHINYNYRSIMHYGETAFSKTPGLKTIEAVGIKTELGNTEMSPEDIIEVDALYRCKTNAFNSWTTWSSYSPCDASCNKNRQRFCYGKTATSCGGMPDRYGIEKQYLKCSPQECPVKINGHWSSWASWQPCSRRCDEGLQTRKRSCDNPEPKNNGKYCNGTGEESRICAQPRCTLGKYDTDFRYGLMGIWQNDIYDTPELNWQINKAYSNVDVTGSQGDSRSPTGNYLYVDSSKHSSNDIARLISKILPKTSPGQKCIKFFYHKPSYGTGSLSLYLYPRGQSRQKLFYKDGKDAEWKFAQVTINANVSYQLVFQAVIKNPTSSDVAIDDIFIDKGRCDCQDKYMVCKEWKKKGYCKNSFKYMFHNCQRKCKFCGCQNNPKWNCNSWSVEECKRNPWWMEVICPVTCEVCGCYDKNIFCPFWEQIGECKRNPDYMKKSCPKSCKICKL